MLLNETYICLILKKIDSKSVFDHHPINLIPFAYKIIACGLCNRLKMVLPHTIALNRLVENKQILDVSLMANELIV